MKISFTKRFQRSYKKLPNDIREKAKIAISLFMKNEKDPKLGMHKLQANLKNKYSIKVDFHYRMVFVMKKEVAIFLDIGDHSIYH